MDKLDIPQGTLDLMILTILAREPMHGYGISQRLAALSHDNFQVNPGSLFPSLYRLEQDGKLKAEWRPTENNRNAKYYRLTAVREEAARTASRALGPGRVRHHQRAGGRMTLLHRLASMLRWVLHRDRAEQATSTTSCGRSSRWPRPRRCATVLPPAEARRLAMLELGGVEQAKERVRTERHGGWLDEVGRDVRYAFRMFARHRGFTAVVVLTLALGIGANTAIFSLIDALMLRWLPVREPAGAGAGRVRVAGARVPPAESFSYAMVRALADQRDIFAGVGGLQRLHVRGRRPRVGRAECPGALVTGGYYETLGLSRSTGRLLTREDDEPGAPLVAVISYGYWERQFARSPGAVGETLLINGVPVTIVGVSPRGFVGANVGSIADITMASPRCRRSSPSDGAAARPWQLLAARARAARSRASRLRRPTARLNAVWREIAEPVIAPHWPASRRKGDGRVGVRLSPGGTGWTYLREIYGSRC